MKKIIIIDSCRICPYCGRAGNQYFCAITNDNVTKWYKAKKIFRGCELDDALIERVAVRSKESIISEGTAECKQQLVGLSDSVKYEPRTSYQFKRQVDGKVRLYPMGESDNNSYYELCNSDNFNRFFKIKDEKSVKINLKDQFCPKCERPIKWCECINKE